MKSSDKRHPHVINQDELEWNEMEHGSRFGSQRKILGQAAGAEKIGCSLYIIPPGRTAFPHHAHSANEEAIYVLEGKGTLRLGLGDNEEKIPLQAGDYAVLPASLEIPHQLINSSDAPLRYLCMSTLVYPEVASYPDSKKVGMLVKNAPPHWQQMRGRGFKMLKDGEDLGYYDDEE